ncbi:MAG: hypothetical protein ACHQT9_03030 [Candidatus Saccharimonadales bacterium]
MVAKVLKRNLKKETGISFSLEEILVALQLVILEKQELLLKVKNSLRYL